MAELTMRQTVLTAILDADPTVRDHVIQRLSADLVKSIPLATCFGGEIIVSLGPVKEIQIKGLCSVRFEQSMSLMPLVRCRDCENWDTDWVPSHAGEGQYFCPILGQVTDTDFYCGRGRRKCGRHKDGGRDDGI